MVWLTRKLAETRLCCFSLSQIPCCSSRCLQNSALLQLQYIPTVYTARYNRIHWQQSCPGKAAAGGCPSTPCSGARARPLPAPASGACAAPTRLEPANADGTRRSAQGSPKHASKPGGEDRSSQRPEARNLSPKFAPNLNRRPKYSSRTKASVEARSFNRSPKCVSRLEALVKVGSQRYCRL